ncbi:calcium and integrin-binding protein 1 [Petromyzon marinus]|uniref:Calcium and integrin-binding protein 1 n=1 Tax=Petromyzon marinus TaxID=7757 RepID=A0AAJ7WRV4_PETMA|nr:calcium and integrin-binding protein 1 [Petromyzon marinus]
MGQASSQLGAKELTEYQELTFLTKQEILMAERRFLEMARDSKVDNPTVNLGSAIVKMSTLVEMPELKANPFRQRICRVFSTASGVGGEECALSFEDFLDLLSAFSDSATPEVKAYYAFRIFDFDDDGTLNSEDLKKLVTCLTGDENALSEEDMNQLIQNILVESDIDQDGTVNLSEFQHVITKSPDFSSSFKIVL